MVLQLFAGWRECSYPVSAALWNVRRRGLVTAAWTTAGKPERGAYVSRAPALLVLLRSPANLPRPQLFPTSGT